MFTNVNDVYFVFMKLVDFHPIYDRQKVRFITTYLCLKAYTTKENIWFVLSDRDFSRFKI
jgi:hypothetical protein